MWGYETGNINSCSQATGGYESPCGVMSLFHSLPLFFFDLLRIPMWGYESGLSI